MIKNEISLIYHFSKNKARKLSGFKLTGMIRIEDMSKNKLNINKNIQKSEGFEMTYEKISCWHISTCRCG